MTSTRAAQLVIKIVYMLHFMKVAKFFNNRPRYVGINILNNKKKIKKK